MNALRLGAIAVSLASVLLLVCCSPGGDQPPRGASADAPDARFVFLEDGAGIDFEHHLVRTGTFNIAEVIGCGLAVFDADGDGDLDLLALDAGKLDVGAPNRLYLRGEDGRYVEADGGPGLERSDFSTGLALGDVDNDGDLDVFVGNIGPDVILINDGRGRFEALDPAQSGIGDPGYATSAVFFDYDLDGLLDLYVCRYVILDPSKRCPGIDGRDDYCHPAVYQAPSDLLYRNLGGGRFQDVSAEMGIDRQGSYGLGVVALDADDDGWLDVYVANDSRPNFLWINKKGKGFKEEALAHGLAVNGQGMPEASMGIAVGDVDGNGLIDIFITHLRAESNTLYLREKGGFMDGTARARLAVPSMAATGFGTSLFDMDNDMDLDLAIANGSVGRLERPLPGAIEGSEWEYYSEPNHLYENTGTAFEMANGIGGGFCTEIETSRALVAADLDQDGDVDLVVGSCSAPLRLYENRGPVGNYIKIRAVDDELRRDALGAVVTVRIGDRRLQRRIAYDGSYLCSVAEPAHFGIGDAEGVDEVEIVWPGGEKQVFGPLPANRSHVLKRGPR